MCDHIYSYNIYGRSQHNVLDIRGERGRWTLYFSDSFQISLTKKHRARTILYCVIIIVYETRARVGSRHIHYIIHA